MAQQLNPVKARFDLVILSQGQQVCEAAATLSEASMEVAECSLLLAARPTALFLP